MDILEKLNWFLEVTEDKTQVISTKCSKFLTQTKGQSLYHGTKQTLNFENKLSTRTRPRDTLGPIHEKLNEAFKQIFGIYARTECLFTTGSSRTAEYFGTPWKIYPANGFKFIWSPDIYDVTDYIQTSIFGGSPIYERLVGIYFTFLKNRNIAAPLNFFPYAKGDLEKCFEQEVSKDMDFQTVNNLFEENIQPYFDAFVKLNYTNKSLSNAISSGHEIMLYSPVFYAIKA